MKILSIGNSFSENMHRYAHQMAEAAGTDLTVVNAFYGGCTMRRTRRCFRKSVRLPNWK